MAGAPPPPPVAVLAGASRKWGARVDQWKRTWYLLRRNTLALVGFGILLALVVMALYASTLPLPWNQMNSYCEYSGPGCTHVCTYTSGAPPGPDCYPVNYLFPAFVGPTLTLTSVGPLPLGSIAQSPTSITFYNVEQGILRGSDWSLLISISVVASGAAIGLLLGGISGFFGGVVDETLMRITDIFLSIPYLLFIIVVLTVFSQLTIPGLAPLSARILLMILAFIIVWWPTYARIVRGQVLVVREQKYVEAARASGAGRGRLLLRHILPNSMYPVFIQMSLDVGTVPILIGSLSFLGFNLFGIPFTQVFPEWGSLAAYSIQDFTGILGSCAVGTCIVPWWQIFFPGIMLFLFAISVNFFADGLRDALDPRLRR
jgi:peptide/nickel transport system permease protein